MYCINSYIMLIMDDDEVDMVSISQPLSFVDVSECWFVGREAGHG